MSAARMAERRRSVRGFDVTSAAPPSSPAPRRTPAGVGARQCPPVRRTTRRGECPPSADPGEELSLILLPREGEAVVQHVFIGGIRIFRAEHFDGRRCILAPAQLGEARRPPDQLERVQVALELVLPVDHRLIAARQEPRRDAVQLIPGGCPGSGERIDRTARAHGPGSRRRGGYRLPGSGCRRSSAPAPAPARWLPEPQRSVPDCWSRRRE